VKQRIKPAAAQRDSPAEIRRRYPAFSFELNFVERDDCVFRLEREDRLEGSFATCAAKDFEFSFVTSFVAQTVNAPGHGSNARIFRSISAADSFQSIRPCSRSSFAA